MHATPQTPIELIRLSESLLSRFGRDIEDGERLVRGLVLSDFFITTCSEEPDLVIYRISQLDNERNICYLFAAALHEASGRTDLQLFREGPWEKTFRELGTEMMVSKG
jgi:hypothetical protein